MTVMCTAPMPDAPGPSPRAYDKAVASFDMDALLATLTADGSHGANAADLCCDRHVDGSGRIALRHRDARGATTDYSFGDLQRQSTRFAQVLAEAGVHKGDRVAGLLPRTPELLITILATWRLGAIYQPLFTAFGPKAIEHRVGVAATKVVVTDATNRSKLDTVLNTPVIVTVGATPGSGDVDFWPATNGRDGTVVPVSCAITDPFLMMFTSGTTGLAKPMLVPLKAIAAFAGYMRDAVGLRDGDRFWNLADPGWAYGLYYAVIGPLALGMTTVFHEGAFSVDEAYRTIAEYGITHLAGSPTAFRLFVGDGPGKAEAIRGRLRAVSSAGEPLNPEIIRWFDRHLHTTIHDHYGQTELGMVLCNHHALDHPIRIGSAGYASPGHRVVVLCPDGNELGIGEPGDLAIDVPRSPLLWFTGYHGRETPAFKGDHFLTGDTAELNDDGSISFVGRADDVITTSGYRVGPFDVESALMEHDAVLESAVIGKPDPERTEIIKAFVVLKPGRVADAALGEMLRLHVRSRLSAHAYPREIEFVTALPKTPSGKVQRFLLRNQERAKADPPA